MHKSVGVIIRKKDKILMIDRVNYPYGWACPAGHVDPGESPEEAMLREAKEEVNIDILKNKLLIEEFVEWNECSMGDRGHSWCLYEAQDWEGEPEADKREAKKMSWIDTSDLSKLNLEPVWEYFFKKIKLI